MTRADERLQRLLIAFPTMADEMKLTMEQLAERVGTDVKTLREDFLCLDRDDTPPGFVESVQLYVGSDSVSMRSSHFKRPMRLTRPEVASLELGLGILEQELAVDERHLVTRVRGRLRDLAVQPVDTVVDKRKVRSTAEAAGGLAVEPARDREWEALVVLQRAIEHQQVVMLTYQRSDETAATERRVRPYAMVRADANIYLVAFCERHDALRVFRLDRVRTAVETSDRFERPDDFTVESVVQQGHVFVQDAPAVESLVVRYSPTVARWIVEREAGVMQPDGSLEVRYPLADESWAMRHVLQYGPDAVILAPDRVRDEMERVLQRALDGCGQTLSG
ncbi:helix-turn-helix transcriptional regulator [Gemmatimonas sp.]|uniref:helix-turn-helix transcriptional regulator n=1 Tax=Gemmatimonas sp. TaxID=1962908 RepID=UPI003983A943